MLHEASLKKLTEIGPKHTEEFKQIMASNASYSESLKSAIRNQQAKATNESEKSQNKSNSSSAATFQLKVDFSKYKWKFNRQWYRFHTLCHFTDFPRPCTRK